MLQHDVTASISSDSIHVTFIKGTVISHLVPTITYTGKSLSPADKVAQDFTTIVKYRVTAADSSSTTYTVYVDSVSDDKMITSFSFTSSYNSPNLQNDINGKIGSDSIIVTLPFGAKVDKLVPTITTTGKSISPNSNTVQNFTNPVTYTVTADDGTTKNYVVQVFDSASSLSVAGTIFITGFTDHYMIPDSSNLYAIDAATGILKWSFTDANVIYSSPTIANGVAFVADRAGNVFALDVSSGNLLWKTQTDKNTFYDNNLTVDNGILYEGGNNSGVYVLDAATGNLKWSFTTGTAMGSPTVVNDIVYFGGNYNIGQLIALNSGTGSPVWEVSPSTDTSAGFPMNPAVVNGILYIGCTDRNLYALNAQTGNTLWTYPTGDGIETSPTVVNGIVYFGSLDGKIYALDAQNGSVKWRSQSLTPIYGSPIVADSSVYFASNAQYIFSLDINTGNIKWTYPLENTIYNSPLYFDGLILMGSFKNLLALNATTGQLIWQFSNNGRIFLTPCATDNFGNVFYSSISGNQN